MGLIKAGMEAVRSTLADQWKEYFYCDALGQDVLVLKGRKRAGKKGSNTKGSDNIISNGSVIAVNEGQCMLIVEQGQVTEVCAEAGEFIYDTSKEPSVFCGDLGKSLEASFAAVGRRFAFGGDAGRDQRVYFVNTREIMGNKYGTANPVPYRVVDANIGLDMEISIRCHGEYSYRIADPVLFYTNVCGNVTQEYRRESLESQMRSELLTGLQAAFAAIADQGIRYYQLTGHTGEIASALNEALSEKWKKLRGIEIVSFGISGVKAPEEDEAMIRQLQRDAALRNPAMAAATLTGAQADAMKKAASNTSGAMMGFAGMNMAQGAGNINAADLYAMAQQQQREQKNPVGGGQNTGSQNTGRSIEKAGWACSCGATGNTGKFCMECGKPKEESNGWKCSCGTVNKGKFCSECGQKKPAGEKLYRCDKCGWEPKDPAKPPKFCPECGDPFDESDVK